MDNFLKIKPSGIQGKGVFTENKIPAGQEFYFIPTTNISEAPHLGWAYIKELGWINDEKILNYVNHSCEPNTKIITNKKRPYVISIEKISQGEEITVDYNKTENEGAQSPCSCKSSNCKGYFLRIE